MKDLGWAVCPAALRMKGNGGRRINMPPYVSRWSSTRKGSRRSSARAEGLELARGQLRRGLPMSGLVSLPDAQAKRLVKAERMRPKEFGKSPTWSWRRTAVVTRAREEGAATRKEGMETALVTRTMRSTRTFANVMSPPCSPKRVWSR